MATDAVLIATSVGSSEEADRIANAMVYERLAACVQIFPVTSIYRWKGRIERAGELMIHIKTSAAMADRVRARMAELHSYELPEFIVMPIVEGSAPYLDWIADGSTGEEG